MTWFWLREINLRNGFHGATDGASFSIYCRLCFINAALPVLWCVQCVVLFAMTSVFFQYNCGTVCHALSIAGMILFTFFLPKQPLFKMNEIRWGILRLHVMGQGPLESSEAVNSMTYSSIFFPKAQYHPCNCHACTPSAANQSEIKFPTQIWLLLISLTISNMFVFNATWEAGASFLKLDKPSHSFFLLLFCSSYVCIDGKGLKMDSWLSPDFIKSCTLKTFAVNSHSPSKMILFIVATIHYHCQASASFL